MFNFKITTKDKKTKARSGILKTPHGVIHTPAFVPVSTKGALRGLSFEDAKKYGADVFMVNTYHLFHNSRYKIIKKFGGLHKYLKINFPLMTDSGGFQVFSLGFAREHGVGKIFSFFPGETKNSGKIKESKTSKNKNLVKIYDDGVEFRDPISGTKLNLTPELSMKIQADLGADLIFTFDECTSPLSDYAYTKKSLLRTNKWAIKSLSAFEKYDKKKQALFGIVQGGEWKDLRKESARFIGSLPFFGIGIGGSLGKSKKDMRRILDFTLPLLPEEKPKHLLGIGEVEDIFNGVERGIDLFDCVIPTRLARHGTAFTHEGKMNLKNSGFLKDKNPIDKNCLCRVCKIYSRSYVSHLLREKEIYGIMLLTEHNLAFMLNLMKEIRRAIKENYFLKIKRHILSYLL
ncbi:MAG: tRNA guanosine(34) transglycosylase Tgt [Parcubacteria group bacterium]|nr:tRNA guanosine(34) transglycosylase Tgt [Parcubacteria group bacterium]